MLLNDQDEIEAQLYENVECWISLFDELLKDMLEEAPQWKPLCPALLILYVTT